jgi:hypothetical protein
MKVVPAWAPAVDVAAMSRTAVVRRAQQSWSGRSMGDVSSLAVNGGPVLATGVIAAPAPAVNLLSGLSPAA